ncbi:MAG: hypothetical protein EA402_00305 [Planctomycetota bacterium]|nr:MAG: hypothetical protein EA402_00305 [Planctomycetota bacterium]
MLSREQHQELLEAYEWLRMVEHRLQMWESRQIHELPGDSVQRQRVADRCGYHGADGLQSFEARLGNIRLRVRALAEEHYLGLDDERMAAFALINGEQPSPAVRDRLLAPVGFSNPDRAVQMLRSLAHEPFFLLRRSRTEHALADLLPHLLLDIGGSPNPDRALHNFVRIVESVGGRALFYEQLERNGDTRRRLTNLAGWADSLVDTLVAHPGLADEVVERLQRGAPSLSGMLAELHDLLEGQDQHLPPLQFFQARELVAAAVEDLEGLAPWAISRHLSALAQAVVQALLQHHVAQMTRRWGAPLLPDGRPERFAILGMGKCRSGEKSYASALDVMFDCDGGGRCPDGEHDGDAFWQRVAQGIIRDCQQGRLYELDARLRPWGEQGALVVSTATLERYWSQPRDLWERLAHTRLCCFAGDTALGEEMVAGIAEQALGQPLPEDGRAAVVAMRRRLEESVSGQDHVKRGPGGYVDVEFLVQFAVIGGRLVRHSAQALPQRQAVAGLSDKAMQLVPPVLHDLQHLVGDASTVGQPIASLLRNLAQEGVLDAAAAADLLVGLTLLRWIESRMRLFAGKAISHLPTADDERLAFARCAGYDRLEAMDRDLHLVRERCRQWFDYYLCPSADASDEGV